MFNDNIQSTYHNISNLKLDIYHSAFKHSLKPYPLLTSLLQLFILCYNHWESQQLTASQYVHCLISMQTRERCELRLMKGKDTDIVQYFKSEKNNQQWLWSNIQYSNILKFLLISSFIFEVWWGRGVNWGWWQAKILT